MENNGETSYDEGFDNISNLKWLPWVGRNYKGSPNKLLIIGESHYKWTATGEETPKSIEEQLKSKGFTRWVIETWALDFENSRKKYKNNNRKLFDGIENVLLGTKNDNLWQNVAFYNFIQRDLDWTKKEDKEIPKPADWLGGREVFFKVLNILKPTHCLFCGVGIASSLYKQIDIKDCEKVISRGVKPRIAEYQYKDKDISFNKNVSLIFILHPSWIKGKAIENWGKFVKEQWGEPLCFKI